MPIETLILGRKYGGRHKGRQIRECGIATHQIAAMAQHLAVHRKDRKRGRVLDVVEAGCVGQVQPIPEEKSAKGDSTPKRNNGAAVNEISQKRASPRPGGAPSRPARSHRGLSPALRQAALIRR